MGEYRRKKKQSELQDIIDDCEKPRDYFHRIKELKRFGSPLVENMEIDSIIDFVDQGRIEKAMEIIKRQEKEYFDAIREHRQLVAKKQREKEAQA